ncbi:MAG TPA: hypothetical protein VK662_10815 [Acidothermaceae bacterium]|jgi:hypothetical protein|nr:hypothetical protein [Acidothermaceae bacterium]
MFVQIIQGTVTDADALQRSIARWRKEIKPGARGYLGSTGGVTPDGRGITMVRFESEADAQANSDRAEQGAWWNEASKAFGDDVTFHNCTEVETILGGGNDTAGFVQVLQGRTNDQAQMRATGRAIQDELHALRPEILGVVVAFHGDGGFTQAIYFSSEEAARGGEKAMGNDSELSQRLRATIEGDLTFFDLKEPDFD